MGSHQSPPMATVAIISIGDMGVGIARLLIAHHFRVVTNAEGRSEATKSRATQNAIALLPSDVELVNQADYVLSIVPPRDALATAMRIISAVNEPGFDPSRKEPLYFLDLNAVSPSSAREIASRLAESAPTVRFIDGGIIGGPPSVEKVSGVQDRWNCPSVPLSGPHRLDAAPVAGATLAKLLETKFLDERIGSASGLKMCFASLSKGFTALAIEAFTTAHQLGVLAPLRSHLEMFNPHAAKSAERGLVSMPPKAYRWVREMEEIARTFEEEGGFESSESMFRPVARVYEFVADGTELGMEKVGERRKGGTAEEVAALMGDSLKKRKEKVE